MEAGSPVSKAKLVVRAPPSRQAWYRILEDGSRELALPEFDNVSSELAIAQREASSPPSPRQWLLPKSKKMGKPTPHEPYELEVLRREKPVRHYWKWEYGVPRCLHREQVWNSAEYISTRLYVLENGIEFAPPPLPVPCCLLCRSLPEIPLWLARVEAANQLPHEWGQLAAVVPTQDPDDLQTLVARCSLAGGTKVDPATGGNLMYYAAKAGDSMLCEYLVSTGHAHLVAEIGYDGRTAYEIALESGYPDTAYILAPYVGTNVSLEKRQMLHERLCEELEYVLRQDGVTPPPVKKTTFFAHLTRMTSRVGNNELFRSLFHFSAGGSSSKNLSDDGHHSPRGDPATSSRRTKKDLARRESTAAERDPASTHVAHGHAAAAAAARGKPRRRAKRKHASHGSRTDDADVATVSIVPRICTTCSKTCGF